MGLAVEEGQNLKSKETSITRLKTIPLFLFRLRHPLFFLKSKRNLDYEIENDFAFFRSRFHLKFVLEIKKKPRFTRLKTSQ